MRLSCAAVVCRSQTQFYYDGRRQLQPLVRQRAREDLRKPRDHQQTWLAVSHRWTSTASSSAVTERHVAHIGVICSLIGPVPVYRTGRPPH